MAKLDIFCLIFVVSAIEPVLAAVSLDKAMDDLRGDLDQLEDMFVNQFSEFKQRDDVLKQMLVEYIDCNLAINKGIEPSTDF